MSDSFGGETGTFVYSPTIMKLVGALMALIGVGFIAAGLAGWFEEDPMLGWFMGGLFLIIALIFFVFIRFSGRQEAELSRLRTEGIAGQATVVGVTQTGVYMNRQPKVIMDLLVQLPDRQPYQVRHSEYVPLIMTGRLTSGQPLPVMVDRTNPQKLLIDWSGSFTGAFAMPQQAAMPAMPGVATAMPGAAPMAPGTGLGSFSPAEASQYADMTRAAMTSAGMSASAIDETMAQVQAALNVSGAAVPAAFNNPDLANVKTSEIRAYLREHGVPATARIDRADDTGQLVGDERLFTMQVTLEMPGQPPKQLQPSAAMVPLHAVPKVKVGWRLPVRVHADNHQAMMIEWDKV